MSKNRNQRNVADLQKCTGGPDVIRKEAWPFYRTVSGVRLCWELKEPKGPKGISALRPWTSNVRCCRTMFIEASKRMFIKAPTAPIWTHDLFEKNLYMFQSAGTYVFQTHKYLSHTFQMILCTEGPGVRL